MRRLGLAISIVFAVAGCTSTDTTVDFAVNPPGCRLPSKCFQPSMCDCTRGSLTDPNCMICDPAVTDPTIQQCDCNPDAGLACDEPGQLCVGRGPICGGAGAHCLPFGDLGPNPCANPGEPPELVAIDDFDAGPSSLLRCAFVDDQCCIGSFDLGVPDLAVPDLGVPDLAGVD